MEVLLGLVESFGSWTVCPGCGERTAKKFLWAIKCANGACSRFDPVFQAHAEGFGVAVSNPAKTVALPPDRVLIQYRNFRHVQKTFNGERRSLSVHGNHIGVVVAPRNKRIYLSRDRIANLAEFAGDLPVGGL